VSEADHSPPSSAEVKDCVDLYLHSSSTPSWSGAQLKHRDNFTFIFTQFIVHFLSPKIPDTVLKFNHGCKLKYFLCTLYFFLKKKKAVTVLRGSLAYPNGLLDLHIETFGRTPWPGHCTLKLKFCSVLSK
jgi:hypothetical protein